MGALDTFGLNPGAASAGAALYWAPSYFPGSYFTPFYWPGLTAPEIFATELEAIYALYLESPDLVAACGGRFFLDEAPEDPSLTLPYVTYMLAGRDITPTTGALEVWHSLVQFSIHDRLPSKCEAIAQVLRATFSKASLAINGLATGHCLKANEGLAKAEGKAPGGKDCWMHTLDYDILWSPDTPSGS